MLTAISGFRWHKLLLIAFDALLVNAALLISLWLRFEGVIPSVWWPFYESAAVWFTPLTLLACYAFGLYNRVWEYARGDAALAVIVAVSSGMLVGFVGLLLTGPAIFSKSIVVMAWLFTMMLIGGSRFGWRQIRRYWRMNEANGSETNGRRHILIYGARGAGSVFAGHVDDTPNAPYRICGFVDDAPRLRGMIVGRYRVLGTGDDLPALVKKLDVEEVILAVPSASGEQLRAMRQRVKAAGVEATTLPRLLETIDGEVASDDVRNIEYADMLGRDMTDVDLTLDPNYVEGRTVLVTGAGGSIGSEICRQLCRYSPKRLVLLGRGENRIHDIYLDLRASFPDIEFVPVICNFTNEDHVDRVFAKHRPEIVFHAGAHKHVYLMEDCPAEAVRNNVLGTAAVACAANRYGVERFVAISTDKAVEPISVMGASKRLCEILLTSLNEESDTKFTVVRFGNVLGSSGSVLTIFQNQAAAGRPLTVTHMEATRYFMAVAEAAFLVLQAGALGDGGCVFVLEMGEPVCIYDMAREFLELYGRDPDELGAIRITSLSQGEKVHERLCRFSEELEPTTCPYVNRAAPKGPAEVTWSHREIVERARRVADDPEAAAEFLRAVHPPLVAATTEAVAATGGE